MRVMYEAWFEERVSNIAYNIVNGQCTPILHHSAPVYITIGDGGNLEGLATNMTEPQPKYSAFREASFGHAIFDIKNRTHAYFSSIGTKTACRRGRYKLLFYNRFYGTLEEVSVK
ncbi:hypothetical protein HPP92_018507 [Vanilla planifolia]|uniref:Purple acid phosphatase C-terminal domain-containing protein n=1 Tax=Vanilla planifolia TaxID=51239 RepID=A0A835UMB6_VANPL|nr:hypothetical protein HPP92_018507 [Vanilla planifolia]